MKVHLYAQCWNDAPMLPFFFRHYDHVVDDYFIFDDGSTDDSRSILEAHPHVHLAPFPRSVPDSFVLSEQAHSNACWKASRGAADWVIVTDIDEHLWHPQLGRYLRECQEQDITIIPALGFQMIADAAPVDDVLLADAAPMGAPRRAMMKPSVFAPEAIDEIDYAVGRHRARPTGRVVAPPRDELLLLHFRYIGFERTYARNQELQEGLGASDAERSLGLEYGWTPGRLRADWDEVRADAFDTRTIRRNPARTYPFAKWWDGLRTAGPSQAADADPALVEAVQRAMDIPGWTDEADGLEIARAASRASAHTATVVEIGAFMGRCTTLLAGGLKAGGGGRIHTVDPFDASGDPFSVPHYLRLLAEAGSDSLEEVFGHNLERAGVADLVTVHRGTAAEIGHTWTEPIDMLLLDGDQSVAGAREAFETWIPHVRPGGTVVLRNTADREFVTDHDGHRRLVEDEVHAPAFEAVRQLADTTIALKARPRRNAPLKLFVCIYDDVRLLPAFLRHYTRVGVDQFHVAAPDHLADRIREIARGYSLRVYQGLDVEDSFLGGVAAVSEMRERSQDDDEAVLVVDLDEFVEFDRPIDDVIAAMEAEGANVVRGIMWDRFAIDGQPKTVSPISEPPTLFPVRARFIREVMHGADYKGVIVKGRLESNVAHHSFVDEQPAGETLEISHYKWTDRALGRVRSARQRLEAKGKDWAHEYGAVLEHYASHGRFDWQSFGGEVVGHREHRHRPSSEFRVRSVDLSAAPDRLRVAELAATERVLASGSWILGDEVIAFEREWAATCGTREGVGTASGQDAIELGLRALGLGPGDEVIVPAMTAYATVLAVLRAGCDPVIADVDERTVLLDEASVDRCLTDRTKAVILVHLYGRVADIARWRSWTAGHDLHLIEDCAQAHAGEHGGMRAGAGGVLGAFSFYPTKNLGATGDAGMVVTSELQLAQRVRQLRDYGRGPAAGSARLGANSRMDELQAALLRCRLPWLAEHTVRRRSIAADYQAGISNPLVELPPPSPEPVAHVHHQFVVRCEHRDALATHLAEAGVQTQVHYARTVVDEAPASSVRLDPGGIERARKHARTCLSLPVNPHLTDEDVALVIEAVNRFR